MSSVYGAHSVRASDVDLDGDPDLDAVITCYGIGELHWVELSEFTDSGWLQSSILDTGENPQWASIEWDSYLPANTDIVIRFKSSDDYGNMGSWSAGYSTPSEISGALNGDERIMIFDSSGRMVWSSGILDRASISITVPASALCSGSYRACLQNMEGSLISLPLVLLGS